MRQDTRMTWRNYLRPNEAEELARIDADKKANRAMQRRIYDRCRKRALTSPSITSEGRG